MRAFSAVIARMFARKDEPPCSPTASCKDVHFFTLLSTLAGISSFIFVSLLWGNDIPFRFQSLGFGTQAGVWTGSRFRFCGPEGLQFGGLSLRKRIQNDKYENLVQMCESLFRICTEITTNPSHHHHKLLKYYNVSQSKKMT